MSSDIQVREYRPEDFSALYKLDRACFESGIAYSKNTLRYFLELPASTCVLATIEEDIAGFIVSEMDGARAHIITLDVAEKYRRRGIGTVLIDAVEHRLASLGVRSVLLETAINNDAAVSFWQRHGYQTLGTLKRYYLNRIDAYQMRKFLPPHDNV